MPPAPSRLLLASLLFAAHLTSAPSFADEPTLPSVAPKTDVQASPLAAPSGPMASQPASPLTITSNTDCPSGPAVMDALAKMSPPAEWPRGSVRIHATSDLLLVDLTFEESTRREVAVPPDCEARSATVALLIATWTGQLSSDAAAMPVLPTKPAPPSDTPPRPTPSPPSAPIAPATPTSPLSTTQRELGAGLLLAFSGGVAPGIALHFLQTRSPRGLGWQAALALPARRNQSSAGWTRAAASLELNARAPLGRLAASVDAGLAAAYTLTSGQGYSIDQDLQSLTAGLVAGLRLALPWRHFHVWTSLRIHRWLLPQRVAVTTPEGAPVTTLALPSTDFHCTIGLSYVFH